MVNDSSFKKVCRYKKYKDCYDKNSLECVCAFWGALISVAFLYIFIKNSDIEQINDILSTLTKDIAISLIGFLGFTVAGLAILTGVISQKVIQKVSLQQKVDRLEKILLSFYLLGIVNAIVIVILFWMYIMVSSDLPLILSIIFILGFITSYFIIFILFYAVKLIGNCLEIFFIVNSTDVEEKGNEINLKDVYNSYRITALEYVCLSKLKKEDLETYKRIIGEQIHENNQFVEQLDKMLNEHFGTIDNK